MALLNSRRARISSRAEGRSSSGIRTLMPKWRRTSFSATSRPYVRPFWNGGNERSVRRTLSSQCSCSWGQLFFVSPLSPSSHGIVLGKRFSSPCPHPRPERRGAKTRRSKSSSSFSIVNAGKTQVLEILQIDLENEIDGEKVQGSCAASHNPKPWDTEGDRKPRCSDKLHSQEISSTIMW